MKKSLKRAVAVSAAGALCAGLAGTMPAGSAVADEAAPAAKAKNNISNFGMTGLAYGTKVVIGGADVKSLKDAKLVQACTRSVGKSRTAFSNVSTAALPIPNDLIRISPSTSSTETYTDGAITGVRSINTIADIAIGGEVIENTLELPTIKLKGLTSVADSFHDPNASGKKYGTNESFSFEGLTIDLPDNLLPEEVEEILDGTGLGILFDILDVVEEEALDPVLAGVSDLVNALLEITDELGLDGLEIPGLGKISLGNSGHRVKSDWAQSRANALTIAVDPSEEGNDSLTELRLGYAQARIGGPARSSVFRSSIMGLDLNVLALPGTDAILRLGGLGTQAIPCEGSDGKKVTKKLEGSRSIPIEIPGIGGAIATLTGLEYSYKAKQLKKGRAKSTAISKLGSLTVPALDLEIQGVTTRVKLFDKNDGKRVKRKVFVKAADILQGGESLIPEDGLVPFVTNIVFDAVNGEDGIIEFGVDRTKNNANYYGKAISGMRISVLGASEDINPLSIDIGWAKSAIYPK